MSEPKFRGRLIQIKPFPCPLCGETIEITDRLVIIGVCPSCHGDWTIEVWKNAARRAGEFFAKKHAERVLKILEGDLS